MAILSPVRGGVVWSYQVPGGPLLEVREDEDGAGYVGFIGGVRHTAAARPDLAARGLQRKLSGTLPEGKLIDLAAARKRLRPQQKT